MNLELNMAVLLKMVDLAPINTSKILVDILLPHLHSVDVYLLELRINI